MPASRTGEVAAAISNLDYEGIQAVDRARSEYDCFRALVDDFGARNGLYVVGICSGLVVHHLPDDGSEGEYWTQLKRTALANGRLASREDVADIMNDFLTADINAIETGQKRGRVGMVLEQGFADWFAWNHSGVDAGTVWYRLADATNKEPEDPTVVSAMDVYDIITLLETGAYRSFPDDISLPVEGPARDVALRAGLVDEGDDSDAEIRTAWNDVATAVGDELERPISLLRIDRLVRQLGQVIERGDEPTVAAVSYLTEEVGCSHETATRLAGVLTQEDGTVEVPDQPDTPDIAGSDTTAINAIDTGDEWIDLEAKVVQLWDPSHEAIAQTGLLGDGSDVIKFTKWVDADIPELSPGQAYRFENVLTDEYKGQYSVMLKDSTTVEETTRDFERDG